MSFLHVSHLAKAPKKERMENHTLPRGGARAKNRRGKGKKGADAPKPAGGTLTHSFGAGERTTEKTPFHTKKEGEKVDKR